MYLVLLTNEMKCISLVACLVLLSKLSVYDFDSFLLHCTNSSDWTTKAHSV